MVHVCMRFQFIFRVCSSFCNLMLNCFPPNVRQGFLILDPRLVHSAVLSVMMSMLRKAGPHVSSGVSISVIFSGKNSAWSSARSTAPLFTYETHAMSLILMWRWTSDVLGTMAFIGLSGGNRKLDQRKEYKIENSLARSLATQYHVSSG